MTTVGAQKGHANDQSPPNPKTSKHDHTCAILYLLTYNYLAQTNNLMQCYYGFFLTLFG
jgi:hypothetical protein